MSDRADAAMQEEKFRVIAFEREGDDDCCLRIAAEGDSTQVRIVVLKGLIEGKVLFGEEKAGPLIRSTSDALLWDYGPRSTIFGSAPLPDPPRFFHEFFELVESLTEGARDAAAYLAWNGRFQEWSASVVNRTYRLLTAPAPLAEAATELLERQVANFVLLPEPALETYKAPKIVVRCGRSWFICREVESRAAE